MKRITMKYPPHLNIDHVVQHVENEGKAPMFTMCYGAEMEYHHGKPWCPGECGQKFSLLTDGESFLLEDNFLQDEEDDNE